MIVRTKPSLPKMLRKWSTGAGAIGLFGFVCRGIIATNTLKVLRLLRSRQAQAAADQSVH